MIYIRAVINPFMLDIVRGRISNDDEMPAGQAAKLSFNTGTANNRQRALTQSFGARIKRLHTNRKYDDSA